MCIMKPTDLSENLKNIIDPELSDTIVEAYINSATRLIDTAFTDGVLGEEILTEIEMWLAAHMIASTREQQTAEAKAGQTSVKYQGQTGLGLDSTMYGQTVKILDTTQRLADLGKGRRNVTFYSVPTT